MVDPNVMENHENRLIFMGYSHKMAGRKKENYNKIITINEQTKINNQRNRST